MKAKNILAYLALREALQNAQEAPTLPFWVTCSMLTINLFTDGIALSWLWEWHVKTVFVGLPSITVVQAGMLSILIEVARYKHPLKPRSRAKQIETWIGNAIGVTTFGFVFGYIVHVAQRFLS